MDGWKFRRIAQAIYLMPRTPWTGRRGADKGVLTLEEAARFASTHARQEITPEDFLRAADRGEVQLHTMARRDAWMARIPPEGVVVHESQRRKRVRAGAWVAVPAYACRQLLAWGSASWRTEDELEQDRHGLWWHVDHWMLEPDEPPFDAVPTDCRVSGYAMHALADAFLLHAQERERDAKSGSSELGLRQRRERQQRGFFTLEEAAQALGVQEGMHAGARGTLLEQMVEAVRDGSLTVRHPHTDLPFRPDVVRVFYELVTPGDVDAWLERAGGGFRWRHEPDPIAADAAGAADEPEEGQRATAHRVARRRDVLAPIIEALRRDAADPDDRVSLWAGLLALADGRGRPPPLLGVADGAVQYRADNGEAAFLSRKSFMDRMRRAAKKAR